MQNETNKQRYKARFCEVSLQIQRQLVSVTGCAAEASFVFLEVRLKTYLEKLKDPRWQKKRAESIPEALLFCHRANLDFDFVFGVFVSALDYGVVTRRCIISWQRAVRKRIRSRLEQRKELRENTKA